MQRQGEERGHAGLWSVPHKRLPPACPGSAKHILRGTWLAGVLHPPGEQGSLLQQELWVLEPSGDSEQT